MSDPLAIYLHDHLGGAAHAIELVMALKEEYAGKPLGESAATLLPEIEADRALLKALAERMGNGTGGVKEWAGWLGEKLSRLKLSRTSESSLGLFESLEFLSLGVLGKRALWRVLLELAPSDQRLAGIDFQNLLVRAEAQYARVENWRRTIAPEVFRSAD